MKLLADRDERFKGLFVKVSLLILLAVLGLVINLVYAVVKKGFFTPKTAIYFVADSGQDLKVGTPVKLSGFKIGAISKIDLDDQARTEIELLIENRYFPLLRQDAAVNLKKEGVIGDAILEAKRGSENKPKLLPKARIEFNRGGGLDQIAADLREKLYPALDEINQLLRSLNDPKGDIRLMLGNMRKFTEDLHETHAHVNHIVSQLDEGMVQDIRPSLQSVHKSLGNAESLVEKMNQDIPQMMNKVNASLDSIRKSTETIHSTIDDSAPQVSGLVGETRGLVSDTRNIMDSASNSWPLKNIMQPTEQGMVKMDSHD